MYLGIMYLGIMYLDMGVGGWVDRWVDGFDPTLFGGLGGRSGDDLVLRRLTWVSAWCPDADLVCRAQVLGVAHAVLPSPAPTHSPRVRPGFPAPDPPPRVGGCVDGRIRGWVGVWVA